MKLSFRNGSRTENLTNFPILVHLTSKNFDFTQSKTNGEDIRFIDSDDSTTLSYEIESWNSGAKEAWIWVKVPQIDKTSDGDFITMYWGNAGAADRQDKVNVWNSNFVLVQHLSENSGTTTSDSTANGNNGTKAGSTNPNPATGQIAGAQSFNGTSSDYIRITDAAGIRPANVTVSAWTNPTLPSANSYPSIIDRVNAFTADGYRLFLNGDIGGRPVCFIRTTINNTINANSTISNNQWSHVVCTYDGANVRIYINGNLDITTVVTGDISYTTTTNMGIGRRQTGTAWTLNGTIDEARVSSTARSASWISAEYASMTDSLITYGDPPGSFDLSSLPDGSYLNYGSFPITFSKATTTLYPVNKYQIIIDNGKDGQTIIADNIPVAGAHANHAAEHYHQTNTWKASYDREDDTDTTNDRITISNIPDTTTILQGTTTTIWPLKEGKRTITVRAIDERGNTRDETKTLYLDYHRPQLSGVTINGSLLTPRKLSSSSELAKPESREVNSSRQARTITYTTTSTRPTISGQLQDLPVGDNLGLSNKDKTLGNIKAVYVTIKDAGSGKPITTQEASLSANDCPNQLLFPDRPDLEKGCTKSFLFTPTTPLSYGTYKVTIEGKDKAGNLSLPTAILLTIGSPEPTPISEEQPTPTPSADGTTTPLTPVPTPIVTPRPTPTLVM